MKNNLKKLSAVVLALVITGCNTISPNLGSTGQKIIVNQGISNSDLAELDKEYSGFKTLALTQSYLKRKLLKWLSIPDGPKLIREINYARSKYAQLFKDLMAADNQLYTDINSNGDVNTYKGISDSFRFFLESAGPVNEIPGVSTLAGSDLTYYGDGTGVNVFFSGPQGIARDSNGNIFIADSGNNSIRKITPDGNVTTIAAGVFSNPFGVAADNAGHLYVSDFYNNSIRQIDLNNGNTVTTIAGNGNQGFADGTDAMFIYPRGIAVDNSGHVFVADGNNNRIRMIDLNNSNIVSTIAGNGSYGFQDGTDAMFYTPIGVAADNNGHVYVADTGNWRIRRIDLNNGNTVSTIAGNGNCDRTEGTNASFCYPNGVTADNSGHLYVADTNNNRIRMIDLNNNNNVSTIAGNGNQGFANGTDAKFSNPIGLTVDNSGHVYVADTNNNRIRTVDLNNSNNVSTLSGNDFYYIDAKGTSARLNNPQGIARDSSGNLFVADTYNNRIRKIDSNGNVSTIAGNGSYGFQDGTDAMFYTPIGVAADNSGHVFVADRDNSSIRMIDLNNNNTVSTIAGNGSYGFQDGTAAMFGNPHGVTTDNNGHVYVADLGNNRIRMIDLNNENTVSTIAGNVNADYADGTAAMFAYPAGVVSDNNGHVYVGDSGNQRIRMIDLNNNNTVSTIAGNGNSGFADGTDAMFIAPSGVSVDNSGHVYVADLGNNRIRMVDLNNGNTVSTIGGNGTAGYADGTDTMFNFPFGVTADNSGHVYVADSGNNRIRKVTQ
jgi:sugar lactone lactonase YvrE